MLSGNNLTLYSDGDSGTSLRTVCDSKLSNNIHSSPTSDPSVASAQYRDGESAGEGWYTTSGSGGGVGHWNTVSGDLPHNVHYNVQVHSIVQGDGTSEDEWCTSSEGGGRCGQRHSRSGDCVDRHINGILV